MGHFLVASLFCLTVAASAVAQEGGSLLAPYAVEGGAASMAAGGSLLAGPTVETLTLGADQRTMVGGQILPAGGGPQAAAAEAVPEPGALAALALGLAVYARRRARMARG